ncbi:hypothetical protein EDC04DRAFT_3096758 [Pisolithus marmoratus]|nr:hypothetical protein EDC04DRAFT_3096758 [Pisolithus marmoratus]
MDHLIHPAGTSPYIIVPYKCTESYDGGDFFTYPERKGWAQDIEHYDFGRRTPPELNAFFQTWLFFGCLTEVLKAGGAQLDTNDFIDTKSNTITTQKLSQLITQWKSLWPTSKDVAETCQCRSMQSYAPDQRCSHERCWQSVVRDCNSNALRTTRSILRTVFSFIDLICGTEGNNLAFGEVHPIPPLIPLDPEIALSISALGSALLSASDVVYECPRVRVEWGGAAIMKERLQQANWCPSRIAATMLSLGIEGRYYCAANPVKEAGDHSKCSTKRCVAQTVDTDHYPTRHIPGCSCPSTGVPLEELLDIIRQGDAGHTPVVTWVEGTGGYPGRAVVSDASDAKLLSNSNVRRYVAISHVTRKSDRKCASLCQLSRIQKMVDELFVDRGVDEHIPFWLDTLCVPVGDALKEYRKKCIIRMRTIYQEAEAVLVLDLASILDRTIALFQSAWWRRLWTYQEGILANRLCIRLSDGVQHMHAMEGELQEYYTELEQHGYTNSEIFSLSVGVHFSLGKWYPDYEHKRDMYYLPISIALSNRRTTRGSDETLCLSTTLGIHPAPFLRIEGRKPFLIRYIGSFGRRVVFNSFPRFRRVVQAEIEDQFTAFERDGYRWAPRSLLSNTYAADTMGTRYTLVDVGHPAYEAVLHTDRRGVEGLVVRYPGMRLDFVASRHPTTIVVGDGDVRYCVQLLLDETSDFSGWNRTAQYNLVLSEKPTSFINTPQQEHPVLVKVNVPGAQPMGTMAVLGTCLDPDGRQERRADLPGFGKYYLFCVIYYSELHKHAKLAIWTYTGNFNILTIRYVCRAWVTLVNELPDFDVMGKVLPEESVVWFML